MRLGTIRGERMGSDLRVTLELGPKGKRVAAVAPDWPGLERGAKSKEAALAALESYRLRYQEVAKRAGREDEFATAGTIDLVESYTGPGSTDFWGISFGFSSIDLEPLSSAAIQRQLDLLAACWSFFDDVRHKVSAEMRKGPRGGGRDRDTIVRHVLASEQEWGKKLGLPRSVGAVVTDAEGLDDFRRSYREAVMSFHSEGHKARTWPLSYLIRHTAFHVMDHAWEMEDKDLSRAGAK